MHKFPRQGQSGSGFLVASTLGAHIGQGARPGVAKPGVGIGSGVTNGQRLQDARFTDAVADGSFCDEVRGVEHADQHKQTDCKFKEDGAGNCGFKAGLPSLDVHGAPFFKRSEVDCSGMARVYMGAHLRCPVGLWRVVCGGCGPRTAFRDGAKIVFAHIRERRA